MEMTIEQLKAHAYDCLANIEQWQKELQATNQKIAEKLKEMNKQPEINKDDANIE